MPEEVSLKEYIDSCVKGLQQNILDLKDLVKKQFDLNKDAVKLAQDSLSIRLEHMNEFRNQIQDERAKLATKEELITLYDKLDARLKPLEAQKVISSGQIKLLATLPASIAAILAIVALFKG